MFFLSGLLSILLVRLLLVDSSSSIDRPIQQFLVVKEADELVLEGRYSFSAENVNKTFWICVDYEYKNVSFPRRVLLRPYPSKECGGAPQAVKNLYWYAFRGRWAEEEMLEFNQTAASNIFFPGKEFESNGEDSRQVSSWFPKYYSIDKEDPTKFQITQKHNWFWGQRDSRVDSTTTILPTIVRSVAKHSPIQVRLSGFGLKLTKVYEHNITRYDNLPIQQSLKKTTQVVNGL